MDHNKGYDKFELNRTSFLWFYWPGLVLSSLNCFGQVWTGFDWMQLVCTGCNLFAQISSSELCDLKANKVSICNINGVQSKAALEQSHEW